MVFLAILRLILVGITMSLSLLGYGVICIFVKHTTFRAFKLKHWYLNQILNPILGIKVLVEGKPIETPALYVCNHRSFADPLATLAHLNAFVIAKAEVAKYPLINKGAEITGVIYVNRESKESRNEVRDKMVETIKAGYNVLVFPEGTVGFYKHTLPFRSGIFYEAAENNLTIVPVAIEFRCPEDLWLRRSFVAQYLKQFSKWRTEVKLKFGQPLTSTDGEYLKSSSFDWINNNIAEMQENWSTIDFEKYKDYKPLYTYKEK